MDDNAVLLDSPLRGEWAILNPPGHPKQAFDFLATRGRRFPYAPGLVFRHLFASITVDDTYAWLKPVFAPMDGIVIACHDGLSDRRQLSMIRDLLRLSSDRPPAGSPFQAYGGNYVILKCGDCYPLLAHLRCGSLRVRVGDRVRAGDQLADVGNSGSSIQPHLHFQVMTSENPFPLFKNLLPFRLRQARKRTGRDWQRVANAELKNGDHLLL